MDAYAPSSSRSDPKLRKTKETITEEKPTLEAMFEMKSLTLFTKEISKTRENDRYRNSYTPRAYWNNQRGHVDENRQVPRRNEENKNVNLCEELEEESKIFDP